MPSESIAPIKAVALRVEACEARYLASAFRDSATICDLLTYAAALEDDADRWDDALRHRHSLSLTEDFYGSLWSNVFLAGAEH